LFDNTGSNQIEGDTRVAVVNVVSAAVAAAVAAATTLMSPLHGFFKKLKDVKSFKQPLGDGVSFLFVF
jgi:hypothetical protein